MTRLRSFGATAKQARLRAFGASATPARLRPFGASARHARLRLLLLVAALGFAARPAAAQTEIVEYYGHDALGSIRIVFTASGVATARADYEPFGEAVTIAGMPAGPLPAQQFTGQERDALESQDYFGARYYRPRHGRFSQVDPVYAGLFDPQQWNRYAYARNNPLSFVDPDGRQFRGGIVCPFGGDGTAGCPSITTPVTPPSPVGPPDPTAAAAEALAAMNNSCFGEGNTRACGKQGPQAKGRDGGLRDQARVQPGEGELVTAFIDGALDGALATLDVVLPFEPLAALGTYDPSAPGIQFSQTVGGTSLFILTGAHAANAAKAVTGASSLTQALFARGNGLLNSNDYFRLGFGWSGSAKAGHDVFRVAVGSKRGRVHWHIDLWRW